MKKNSIHIVSGRYSRQPVEHGKLDFSQVHITTGQVKEALFNILGDLKGLVFVDLFSCTGQIGLEALSRQAAMVIFNDKDQARFKDIKRNVDKFDGEKALVFNLDYKSCIKTIRELGIFPDIIFIDPPYPKNSKDDPYTPVLQSLLESECARPETILIIQHPSQIQPGLSTLSKPFKERKYGSNTLSFFEVPNSALIAQDTL